MFFIPPSNNRNAVTTCKDGGKAKPQVKIPGVLQWILKSVKEVITSSCRWLVQA